MERQWTDARDGKHWHVYAYYTGPAMATSGPIPDAGEPVMRFKHPNPESPEEVFATENPGGRDPNDMTDSELQALLDEARAR